MEEGYSDDKSKGPDLSALLNGVMANPAALSMLSSLLGGMGQKPPPPPQAEDCSCPKAPPILPPVQPPRQDNRACLLNALRPYLSPTRCDTIDSLLRILELMEILRKRR